MKLLPSFIIQLLSHRCWPGFFVTCLAFSAVCHLTGCLVVEYFTAGREARWRRIPPSTKQTGSIFLHLCLLNPGCGLVCVNDVPFKWIRVNRFRAAYNEMWHVTVNCVSLTSTSVFRLQSLCCCFELVGIWVSSSWCNVLGKQKGI